MSRPNCQSAPPPLLRWPLPLAVVLAAAPAAAETTCYGDGAYRVCTTIKTHADGSMEVYSSDSMGNTYSSSTDVTTGYDGSISVESRDSLGNSYQIDSWTDALGSHSRDSLGNECTITRTGQMIGCDD